MVYRGIVQKWLAISAEKNFDKAIMKKVKVISASDGKCDIELKVEAEHTNIYGSLHGGLTATLVDIISGFALMTHPKLVHKLQTFPDSGVSIDLHMSYLRAAKVGEEILVKASTVKTGKSLAFLEVKILNKLTGDILVKGSHTKFLTSQ